MRSDPRIHQTGYPFTSCGDEAALAVTAVSLVMPIIVADLMRGTSAAQGAWLQYCEGAGVTLSRARWI
jgi:hypothetical protein